MRRFSFLAALVCVVVVPAVAQRTTAFTHADTLRGSIGPARAWWDVAFYDLHVRVNPADSSIRGWNGITYRVMAPAREMQIDLQVPMEADSMVQDGKSLTWRRDGNAFFVALPTPQRAGTRRTITVYYHGKPLAARRPPWDGGYIWRHDSLGNTWVTTANQGAGASIWWPTKDTQADEPDSQRIAITVPDPMLDVSNGRLRQTTHNADGTTTFEWFVASPINNYDVAVNAGTYAHFSDAYQGEAGNLTMDFWPLAYHLDTARVQWRQAKPMLACFEHWFGPYPWYADGYKLVETPHLGMEHQSAVAYGNHFRNGYYASSLGGPDRWIDFSGMGEGYNWDFIIVHESAHEWFGNNITTKDVADSWVHESFANYAEGLFSECQDGKDAGARYIIGSRRQIRNDAPIIGPYGVNRDGSGDMYYKGGSMLHTMRQIVDDDEKWRGVLRGLNKTFWHQTVTGRQVEDYINRQSGINFDKVFEQYLTTVRVPTLEYRIEAGTLSFHWIDVVPGFDMPVKVTLQGSGYSWIHPTEAWSKVGIALPSAADFRVDENFYVKASNVGEKP
ncbi:MAG TPA: M1 family metallopeptidase [Acetobacteraceae bacterium]|nr:M1 family metallopeptidase [Acetobacteraceae bacterium]